MKGLNDNEIHNIIEFIIKIRKNGFPLLGIQNFLEYKLGRNPVKQASWEDFNKLMEKWEKKHKINLKEDSFYHIFKTKKLEKPFRKGDLVKAEIICQDRYSHQRIAKFNDRVIAISKCDAKQGEIVKTRIIRDKHNIFVGIVE